MSKVAVIYWSGTGHTEAMAEAVAKGADGVLLTCAEATGDIEQDESFIMRCTTDGEGNACYQSLEDEALIAAVYEAYLAQNEEA